MTEQEFADALRCLCEDTEEAAEALDGEPIVRSYEEAGLLTRGAGSWHGCLTVANTRCQL